MAKGNVSLLLENGCRGWRRCTLMRSGVQEFSLNGFVRNMDFNLCLRTPRYQRRTTIVRSFTCWNHMQSREGRQGSLSRQRQRREQRQHSRRTHSRSSRGQSSMPCTRFALHRRFQDLRFSPLSPPSAPNGPSSYRAWKI